jgi:hypothetical protein
MTPLSGISKVNKTVQNSIAAGDGGLKRWEIFY